MSSGAASPTTIKKRPSTHFQAPGTPDVSIEIDEGEFESNGRVTDPFLPPGSTQRRALGSVGSGPVDLSTSKPSRLRMFWRPRFVLTLTLVFLFFLVLASSNSRTAAHSALQKAGVPLPTIGFSEGFHKLSGGLLGEASRPGGDLDDLLDDEDALWEAGEYEDVPEELEEEPAGRPYVDKDAPVEQLTFAPNGYMLLPDVKPEPAPRHPILQLIEKADKDWDELVGRQSKSLKQCAAEYRKRYKRNPPKGFDKWWKFAVKNNIVLKDEYDQINRDMQAFWALPPSDLLHRTDMMAIREQTFTINVDPKAADEDRVFYTGEEAELKRASDLGELIATFAKDLPATVRLTFTKHDQPACQLGWEHKQRMIELADQGEYFGPSDYINNEDPALTNWANGCPPNSALRQSERNDPSGTRQTRLAKHKSFIHNHPAAMDLCQHPEIMPLHGFTTAIGTNLGELVPLFTFAKTNVHSDVLATPLEQYSSTYIGDDPDWSQKGINKLLWRGSTTGAEFAKHVDWQLSQRARMHFMSHETKGSHEVLYADKDGLEQSKKISVKALNAKYMDTSFSGSPVQCDPETCKVMEKMIKFADTMGLDESYQYKYLLDIDGNGWSGRFHRLMSTKSVVLKSTLFPEWYSERVQPWKHYIPVKIDYSDVYDILSFFMGTPDGKKNDHDALAEKIATAGKEWARDHWRKEDMASYMFRLLLEWSRLLHRDNDAGADVDYFD